MRDDNDGLAVFSRHVEQQLQDHHARPGIESARRLVAEQDLRIFAQSPCYGNALLLAARQLRRKVVHMVEQTYPADHIPGVERVF